MPPSPPSLTEPLRAKTAIEFLAATTFLALLLSYCCGFFIGNKAFLCCLSDGGSMFRGYAAEEPESHVRGL